MKRVVFAAACMLAVFTPVNSSAQDAEEDEHPFLAFQGRVGGVYTGGEPFDNGATFEVAALFRIQGPVYADIYAGSSNFESKGEIIPITEEFNAFWSQLQENFRVTRIDDLRYRLNFVGAGLTAVLGTGVLQPHISVGVGGYQVKFVTSLSLVDRAVPVEFEDAAASFASFQDDKWELGYAVGGGLYYRFNKIINFGGQVTYHAIDTDAIENQISVTFGLHIRVP